MAYQTVAAMARVKMEAGSGIAGLSGRIGNLVFRRTADGTTYAQQAPGPSQRPGSAAQQQYRARFGAAAAYGRTQQTSDEGRAYYQTLVSAGRFASVYRVALADFLKPPQLLAVETSNYQGQGGAQLRIQAHDPYGVVVVWVRVVSATGQVLVRGHGRTGRVRLVGVPNNALPPGRPAAAGYGPGPAGQYYGTGR